MATTSGWSGRRQFSISLSGLRRVRSISARRSSKAAHAVGFPGELVRSRPTQVTCVHSSVEEVVERGGPCKQAGRLFHSQLDSFSKADTSPCRPIREICYENAGRRGAASWERRAPARFECAWTRQALWGLAGPGTHRLEASAPRKVFSSSVAPHTGVINCGQISRQSCRD